MKKNFASLLVILAFSSLFVFSFAHAQINTGGSGPTNTGGSGPTGKLENPFSCGGVADDKCQLKDILTSIVEKVILPIGSLIAVIMFIWTGFMFVMSGGDPGKVKTARASLINTSIGTAVLLGSWVIAEVIKTTVDQIAGK